MSSLVEGLVATRLLLRCMHEAMAARRGILAEVRHGRVALEMTRCSAGRYIDALLLSVG